MFSHQLLLLGKISHLVFLPRNGHCCVLVSTGSEFMESWDALGWNGFLKLIPFQNPSLKGPFPLSQVAQGQFQGWGFKGAPSPSLQQGQLDGNAGIPSVPGIWRKSRAGISDHDEAKEEQLSPRGAQPCSCHSCSATKTTFVLSKSTSLPIFTERKSKSGNLGQNPENLSALKALL